MFVRMNYCENELKRIHALLFLSHVLPFVIHFSPFCFPCVLNVSVSDYKICKLDTEEAQAACQKSGQPVPGVQDPLGSSVMTPDDT